MCQNNAELWDFCQTWLVVSERRLQSSPIFPATHSTNQDLIKLTQPPSQTKRWKGWKNQHNQPKPPFREIRSYGDARAVFESYLTYQDLIKASLQKYTWLVVSEVRLYHMTLLVSYWLLHNWRLLPCQRAILERGLQNNTFPLVRELIKNLTKINDVKH